MHRRVTILISDVHVNVGLQQALHTIQVTSVGRPEQGIQSIHVNQVQVGPIFQQQIYYFQVTHVSCPQQRRQSARVDRVDVGLCSAQCLHHLQVTVGGSPVERSRTILVNGVDICPGGEQQVQNLQMAGIRGEVQSGHTVLVEGVDVGDLAQQILDLLEVTLEGCPDQCSSVRLLFIFALLSSLIDRHGAGASGSLSRLGGTFRGGGDDGVQCILSVKGAQRSDDVHTRHRGLGDRHGVSVRCRALAGRDLLLVL
mmetsp:Transcript_54961/g.96173  ORF Transcript_54961/g.96173 Transcript_54961/m.96173 type:complete len:255 (+) Transcript_54961:3774-4538(+)